MYRYVLSYVSCLSCTFMWSSNYALLYMVIYSLMHASDCLGVLCMLVADVLAELLQPWAYASTYASLCTAMWTSSYASTWSCTTHASDLLCGHCLMHSYASAALCSDSRIRDHASLCGRLPMRPCRYVVLCNVRWAMQCYATFMNRFPYAYLCVEVHVMHSYAAGLLCVICFMHVMQFLCILQAYLLLYVVMCSHSYANLCSLDLMRSPRYAFYVVIMYILCVHFVMQLHVNSGHCNKNVFLWPTYVVEMLCIVMHLCIYAHKHA